MNQNFLFNRIISNFTTDHYNVNIKRLPVLECCSDTIYFLCMHAQHVCVFFLEGLDFFPFDFSFFVSGFVGLLKKTRIRKPPGTCRMTSFVFFGTRAANTRGRLMPLRMVLHVCKKCLQAEIKIVMLSNGQYFTWKQTIGIDWIFEKNEE